MILCRFIIELCVSIGLISCIPSVLGTLIDAMRKVSELLVKGVRVIMKLDEEKKDEAKK